MNKDTEITVRTPVGMTDSETIREGLGQGTNESAIISSSSLSGGVMEEFSDCKTEVMYAGGYQLFPCLFVDDVARLAESLEAVQDGNDRMGKVVAGQLLDFNHDKCFAIVIGGKKFRNTITAKNEVKPLTLFNKPIKIVESEKYLGEEIGPTLSESVYKTIIKRQGLVKRLICEIKVTIEDCRSKVVGGLVTGLEIYWLTVCPFLYYNCQIWIDLLTKALKV